VSGAIQTLANLALVILAALALKVQSDVGGLENFFQSEIAARNIQIGEILEQRQDAEQQLASIRSSVTTALEQQATLRADIARWEQAVAQNRFDGMLVTSSGSSDLMFQEYAGTIDTIRNRSGGVVREPYPDEVQIGRNLIDLIESATFSDASSGVQRRLQTLRIEFLRHCAFLATHRYVPFPLAEPIAWNNAAAAFSARMSEFAASTDALTAEARRCTRNLPSYTPDLSVN
jgi:hypothetical protein